MKRLLITVSLIVSLHSHADGRVTMPSAMPQPADTVSAWTTPDSPLWPASRRETRPGSRWWWLGSSIDHGNLVWLLDEYRKAGLGALEITPSVTAQPHIHSASYILHKNHGYPTAA